MFKQTGVKGLRGNREVKRRGGHPPLILGRASRVCKRRQAPAFCWYLSC